MPLSLPALFVTGTDTGVGKTCVTTRIVRELRRQGRTVGVYKPACSGSELDETGQPFWSDVEALSASVDHFFPRDSIAPQCFHAPLAPPVAARAEGRTVEWKTLLSGAVQWKGKCAGLLIEGAGGLLCPLTETRSMAELVAELGTPILIVARLGLGTINHTLLTVEVAQSRGLSIAGIILSQTEPSASDISTHSNPREIAVRTSVPVLGILPWQGKQFVDVEGREIEIPWWELMTRSQTEESVD